MPGRSIAPAGASAPVGRAEPEGSRWPVPAVGPSRPAFSHSACRSALLRLPERSRAVDTLAVKTLEVDTLEVNTLAVETLAGLVGGTAGGAAAVGASEDCASEECVSEGGASEGSSGRVRAAGDATAAARNLGEVCGVGCSVGIDRTACSRLKETQGAAGKAGGSARSWARARNASSYACCLSRSGWAPLRRRELVEELVEVVARLADVRGASEVVGPPALSRVELEQDTLWRVLARHTRHAPLSQQPVDPDGAARDGARRRVGPPGPRRPTLAFSPAVVSLADSRGARRCER